MKGRKFSVNSLIALPHRHLFHIAEEDDSALIDARTAIEEENMKLTEISFESISAATLSELFQMLERAGIQDDERLRHAQDLRERLILIKRKMEGSSNTWKHLFRSVHEETTHKTESLSQLMKTVETVFEPAPTDSVSEILMKEGYLQSRNLLQEITARMNSLKERRSLVVVAGETNGGKSTFLNLLLGEDILPTDVLHCTFAICKIVYSDEYSIKTLDHNGQEEYFPCASREEVKAVLKCKVSKQEMREREVESPIKEITLGMPADILKSGVMLVDTPGIGENELMDSVTMNFIKSTHTSAFIYIIKSDAAGGVQEDRLLRFLCAIKERYSTDVMMEAFDPRAAMFVCHRWDNIAEQEREKVKENALNKLAYVWPGFDPSQMYLFSTVDTMKHLPVDPEFVTDSFMALLRGMKQLFDRASHNAIKHQYLWLKYMLQSSCRHLRSMITHCILSNEELENYFRSVAEKQNKLMVSSTESSTKLQNELNKLSWELRVMISRYLNFDNMSPRSEIHNWEDIVHACSQENFLNSQANRRELDDMIIQSLLKLVDKHVRAQKLVEEIESKILVTIQEHLGLFKCQIRQIKRDMLNGKSQAAITSSSRYSLEVDDTASKFGASTGSAVSAASSGSSVEEFREEMTFDPSRLSVMVNNLLKRRREGKLSHRSAASNKHEIQESLFGRIGEQIRRSLSKKVEPEVYAEKRVRKLSRKIRENVKILDAIVKSFTEWIQQCVTFAVNSIPKFIEVNTKLMDEIRDHRGIFQSNKDCMVKVMEGLEPCRHHLTGYGLLYMNDINAETVAFNTERRTSTIFVPKHIVAECRRSTDSGFQGSICSGLWANMQGATIKIDDVANNVVIKTYTDDMDEKVILSEIASLRCLEYANLASFLGMTRIPVGGARDQTDGKEAPIERVSAFIFRGDLVSAHIYAKRKKNQQFIPEFIHSLLRGLNYIHREGLVHMELSLNTVMVDRMNGTVKLCHMCKPREAKIPASLDMLAKPWVCLSPSVLQGNLYEVTDDIYAFGLLLWELLFPGEPPYKEQRRWTLRQFIEECHPINMLQGALNGLNASNNLQDVLKGTLLISRGIVCMSIATIQSLLEDLYNEPVVAELGNQHDQVMERISTDSLSAPEVEITSPSGTGRRISFIFVDPDMQAAAETSPSSVSKSENFLAEIDEKPKVNSSSPQGESHVKKGRKLSSPKNFTRGSSEPFVIHQGGPPSNLPKPKTLPARFFEKLPFFGLSKKSSKSEEKLCNNNGLHDNSGKDSLPFHAEKRNRHNVFVHTKCSPPQLRPKYLKTPHGLGTHLHHGSTPDLSSFGSSSPGIQRKESFDVPKLMSEKFRFSFGRKMENMSRLKPVSYSDPLITGSMQSLPHVSNSTQSNVNKLSDAPNPKSRIYDPQSLDFNKSGQYSQNTSWSLQRKRLLGDGCTRSLQDLSGNSTDYTAQSVRSAYENNMGESSLFLTRWRSNIVGVNQTGSLPKRSSQYTIRPSPLAVTNHSRASSLPDSVKSHDGYFRFVPESSENSSVLALSSSTSSHDADSGFCTDASGERLKEILRPFKDVRADFSNDSPASPDVDKEYCLSNESEQNSVTLRSKNALKNGFSDFEKLPVRKVKSAELTNSITEHPFTNVIADHKIEKTCSLSLNRDSELFSHEDIHSQGNKTVCDSNNNTNGLPSPPPINFAELSFLCDSYDSDE